MTRLDALELLLDELKQYDPADYQRVMCQVLADLGYADRIQAITEIIDEACDAPHTLH